MPPLCRRPPKSVDRLGGRLAVLVFSSNEQQLPNNRIKADAEKRGGAMRQDHWRHGYAEHSEREE